MWSHAWLRWAWGKSVMLWDKKLITHPGTDTRHRKLASAFLSLHLFYGGRVRMVKDHKGYLVDLGVVSWGLSAWGQPVHTPSLIGCRLLPYRWGPVLCPSIIWWIYFVNSYITFTPFIGNKSIVYQQPPSGPRNRNCQAKTVWYIVLYEEESTIVH